MKGILVLLIVFICVSCATVKTIDPPGNHVEIAHQGKKSYCKQIPRVYSGVCYNLCLLYGEPSQELNIGDAINGIPFMVFDSAFSLVSDTVVLPYTIPMQAKKGPIRVN
ncbi:YceK/YidQ family lipoprotein [Catenovulum maritimum]|uniref:YceK/YidQ family lipoprotein n=1 Tax=Catenovulum maritimum TaxID=1513271 RepID=A0A0J8GWF3_9ALTE|nr:YceK/YidQ family lipoprotein [Catenovulum maritimum]KMT67087.1 hypothetical protein XM47_00410 [Catenovulum maritimum]